MQRRLPCGPRGIGTKSSCFSLTGGVNPTILVISSFGTFSVREKAARVGRNPKTGQEVPIPPRRVLSFRPSHLMKDRVAAGNKG